MLARVIVSPTWTSLILLIEAQTWPTSPATNSFISTSLGVFIYSDTVSYDAFVSIISIISPTFNLPSTTLILVITPLYGSNKLSKINAFKGLFLSPLGYGIFSIIFSINLLTPIPVLALVKTISFLLKPIFSNSVITLSGLALGRSILLITGIIVKLLSRAKYKFASVCASTPWVASTTSIAPSHDASERDTSYEKSTCPGVSIKLNKYSSSSFL